MSPQNPLGLIIKANKRVQYLQPCPDNVEFRELQCTSFNSVLYKGQLLTWTPHYDDDRPCALVCRAHTGLVAQLAASVRDGTRCRPGSLDMCIDGKCQVSIRST